MREVEERSRRTRDIVRNRNYRQAIDVIEREVKRLEADDKPRARVRFPRDDGDIDIDVGGIIEFAQAMKPKISAEVEDLQDGRTRRGIKAEKIGSTARGFVDLDEDGSPKGVGGTIDSINDANVSVYFGECEQTMSVTMFGKTVTFARNVCEDDRDEEGDDNRRGGDEGEGDAGDASSADLGVPDPPLGYTGQVCMVYYWYWKTRNDSAIEEEDAGAVASAAGKSSRNNPLPYLYYDTQFGISYTVIVEPIGYKRIADVNAFIVAQREKYNLPDYGSIIDQRYSVHGVGTHPLRDTPLNYIRHIRRAPGGSSWIANFYSCNIVMPPPNSGWNPLVQCYFIYRHTHALSFSSRTRVTLDCKWVNNYQPEPPPSLPILPDDMNKDCCDDLIKMTREIHKALGVRKLLDKSFQIPANMMIPEGRGNHQNKDYLEIMSDLFKTIDNYGFDAPVTVTVQDTNKAQEGDQSIELKFNSLGAILKAQTELLIELKGDSANRLNIQIRLAYIMTRMYRTLAKLYYRTSAILDGLGIPIISKVVTLPIEFNVFGKKHWGAGKGFGKDNKKGQEPKLDLNDEDTTEAMLPDLLEIHDYEIEVDEFRAKSNDLYEVLIGIAAKLRS
ncbi:MAG: hypothetical protein P5680_19245 [Limnospira sp. PMC 737.11]|uniref:hypothetical protein n=1 Tax=Limnospira sp. PMC 737.11 TaxID=2981095 RepID=UPI0028E11A5D|nr:hypothetical protein [Limnospira sp. PMC 737.11]MDT9276712.1 hypothetical protein [Limnospira sp. PMC 737.11]